MSSVAGGRFTASKPTARCVACFITTLTSLHDVTHLRRSASSVDLKELLMASASMDTATAAAIHAAASAAVAAVAAGMPPNSSNASGSLSLPLDSGSGNLKQHASMPFAWADGAPSAEALQQLCANAAVAAAQHTVQQANGSGSNVEDMLL
jgi:hypothetical protein